MTLDVVFSELAPYLQNSIKYIAVAASGGIIGNRADQWFMSLFYHQRKRITDWLNTWKPNDTDLKKMLANEGVRILFSKVISEISNEISDTKLLFWPEITNSIIQEEDLNLDKKQYFVALYNRLDDFAIQYIVSIYFKGKIDYFDVFNREGAQPDLGSSKHIYLLGQLQCASTGLTDMTRSSESNHFYLTELGKEFIKFISKESKDLMNQLYKYRPSGEFL